MKLLNDARYLAWRCLDGIHGDSVHTRKCRIKKCIEDDHYYDAYITEKTRELCRFAWENTSFYSSCKGKELQQFPVINKNIIMESFDAFRSEKFRNSPIHTMMTSGSTGRPFKVVQDLGKRRQVLAEIMYFSELVGYRVGKKMVYLRNLESTLAKSALKQFIQNETVIATQKYNDRTLGAIVGQLSRMEKGTTILGYASTLQAIASYMERHNITIDRVTGIISGAEAITAKTRSLVRKQFGCPVVSRYSNQEMGILAQDNVADHFLLNRASYYFELLDMNSDDPVPLGQMGRIVITDLFNYAMPMIRYDTGDLGIMQKSADGKVYLAKVMGRKLDLLYNTKGEPMSFFSLDEFFEPNFDIEQYQVVQEDRTHVTVNVIMKKDKVLDEKWCTDGIKGVMGDDCVVNIRYMDTVPITSSGKFKYVICNYKPDDL